MNIQELVNKAINAFTKDDSLKALFAKEPVKALEKILGTDLPDDIINQVIDGVKKALAQKGAGGILAKLKSLFGK